MNAKDLVRLGEKLFGARTRLLTLWQDIAENFYPERADFTFSRDVGDHIADWLATSWPLLVRRDLGNQLSTMLRPTAKDWFEMTVRGADEAPDHDAQKWLERSAGIMRRAMYDPVTQFTRATKEGDHDFAAFGQCVIECRLNTRADALLYRCWHLRDVAWMEGADGQVSAIFRRWKPNVRDMRRLFPRTAHVNTEAEERKDPFATVECMHIECEADMYDLDTRGKAWVSVFYDLTHDTVLETVAIYEPSYVLPRWQTVSGSQYAYSPATVCALPDARLIQAMTSTLLEAGEKAASPPMIATQEAIRSDVALYAGGITWVDSEYDERLGEVLRPITQDLKGMPIGIDMMRDSRQLIQAAFFLDKLTLPERAPEMTAYEIGQRVQQYIRNALPIFEPMEMSYNGALCDKTFSVLLRIGALGSMSDIPESLRGADVQFTFASPLHDAIEQQKGQKFLESKALLAEAAAIDESALALLDAQATLRDVLEGIGAPAKWIRSEADVEKYNQAAVEQAQQAAQMQQMLAGAEIAQKTAAARKDMSQAGGGPAPGGMPVDMEEAAL